MLKGINQWCFPERTPLKEVFRISREAGYDAVELNLNEEGDTGLTLRTTEKEAEQIRDLAQKYRLQLRSVSTGLLWGVPLSAAAADVRERGRAVVLKQLELAAWLGADTVLVVPGVVNEETSYSNCYDRSLGELKRLVPEAEKKGIIIGIENVWNKFLLSPLEMSAFIDALDSPYGAAYFDVGNVLQFGYPEQWIRILGNRIRKVHVKDFSRAVGNITGFVPLLAGSVNWAAVREELQRIGYADTLTAELSPGESYPLQLVYDTARHIDVIINGQLK